MSEWRDQGKPAQLSSLNKNLDVDLLSGELPKDHRIAERLVRLSDVVRDGSKSECDALVDALIDEGVSKEQFTDYYLPTTARILGDAWCEDKLSFAKVTIGVARLHGMLRTLSRDWHSDAESLPDAPTVLVVVPYGSQHTFGASVIASQLRRSGISVKVCIEEDNRPLFEKSSALRFDAVMISASIGESLEKLRLIVEMLTGCLKQRVPIVIGGTIVNDERAVQSLTGADLVSADLDEAVKFCGLKIHTRRTQSVKG